MVCAGSTTVVRGEKAEPRQSQLCQQQTSGISVSQRPTRLSNCSGLETNILWLQ